MKTLLQLFPLPTPEFTFAGFAFPRNISFLPRGTRADRVERHTKPFTGPYYSSPAPLSAKSQGASFYLKSDFAPGLRWMWADEAVSSINHTGWFCDDHCDSKIRGLVMRLTGDRGFLIGWSMGERMISFVDTSTIYDSKVMAACNADALAAQAAENEREYQESQLDEAA